MQAIDNLSNQLNVGLTQINQRLDAFDQRFDAVDQRFNAVDQRLAQINQRLDAGDQRFDAVDQHLDEVLAFSRNNRRISSNRQSSLQSPTYSCRNPPESGRFREFRGMEF